MPNPNREFQSEHLEQSVENSKQQVREVQVNAAQEANEARELEDQLREAEMFSQRQKEAEEKGRETEQKIAEVAGA